MHDAAAILDQFEQRLLSKGLLIVPKQDWERMSDEANLKVFQKKLLRKKALTFGEIIKGKLLNVNTRNGIQAKIDSGKISTNDVIPGTKMFPKRIMTYAIIKLMD